MGKWTIHIRTLILSCVTVISAGCHRPPYDPPFDPWYQYPSFAMTRTNSGEFVGLWQSPDQSVISSLWSPDGNHWFDSATNLTSYLRRLYGITSGPSGKAIAWGWVGDSRNSNWMLLASGDGGRYWSSLDEIEVSDGEALALEAVKSRGNIIAATGRVRDGARSRAFARISIDQGISWRTVTDFGVGEEISGVRNVALLDGKVIFTVATAETGLDPDLAVLLSEDQGLTWRIVDRVPHVQIFSTDIAADDAGRIYVVGTSEPYSTVSTTFIRTSSDALSWKSSVELKTNAVQRPHSPRLHPVTGGMIVSYSSSNSSVFRRTTDGGMSWTEVITGASGPYYSIIPAGSDLYSFNGYSRDVPRWQVIRSSDYGMTWTSVFRSF